MSEKSRNPRWPPLKNDDVIRTSGDVINSCCGRQGNSFRRTIYLLSFIVMALTSLKLKVVVVVVCVCGGGGGGGGGVESAQERKTSPG